MSSHLFYSNNNAYHLHNIENKQNRKMIAFRVIRVDSYHAICVGVWVKLVMNNFVTPCTTTTLFPLDSLQQLQINTYYIP